MTLNTIRESIQSSVLAIGPYKAAAATKDKPDDSQNPGQESGEKAQPTRGVGTSSGGAPGPFRGRSEDRRRERQSHTNQILATAPKGRPARRTPICRQRRNPPPPHSGESPRAGLGEAPWRFVWRKPLRIATPENGQTPLQDCHDKALAGPTRAYYKPTRVRVSVQTSQTCQCYPQPPLRLCIAARKTDITRASF